jgi:hypothetical protein
MTEGAHDARFADLDLYIVSHHRVKSLSAPPWKALLDQLHFGVGDCTFPFVS